MARKPTCLCGECKLCKARESNRRRRALQDPQKNRDRVRQWREKYPERAAASVRAFRQANPEYPRKRYLERLEEMREQQRRRHARNGQSRKSNLRQQRAHQAVARAIRRGELKRPDACEGCERPIEYGHNGQPLLQGHHHDYSKPLDVQWLCTFCHAAIHRNDAAVRAVTDGEDQGHTQACADYRFQHHAATGGDADCICGAGSS